jgi:uncharacterized membrane protein
MTQNFINVFQYLKKENITIDRNEFSFQIQSNPDYPSLLSIVDTLSFFNVKNAAIRVPFLEIELLPDYFIAMLNEDNDKPTIETLPCFIERKDNTFFCTQDNKTVSISKEKLELRWFGIVLLVEKPETEEILFKRKNTFSWFLSFLFLISFLAVLLQFEDNLQTQLFFIFPALGILFSIATLKDLFGTKSELLNSFCNMTTSTSCSTVVGSTKWKIFEIVNFGDLSIVFFAAQILGLLVFLISKDAIAYFAIQKALLLASIPVLFLSVYYQKFVEKKWCPLCLAIIGIIISELCFVLFLQRSVFEISSKAILNFGFIFVSIALTWSSLKKLLTQQKELKEFQLKGKRFMRNYEIFKNNLLASNQIELDLIQSRPILLGNTNARLKIIVLTSPFCSHCAEVNAIIKEILDKHRDKVCFDIRFNFSSEFGGEKSKIIHQQLVAIYYEKGEEAFFKALQSWFENKDEKKLNSLVINEDNELKINSVLEKQFNWNQKIGMTYTPAIIINQFVFPKQYERNELIHFINELSEDEDFYR